LSGRKEKGREGRGKEEREITRPLSNVCIYRV